jgi:hypothetical protein
VTTFNDDLEMRVDSLTDIKAQLGMQSATAELNAGIDTRKQSRKKPVHQKREEAAKHLQAVVRGHQGRKQAERELRKKLAAEREQEEVQRLQRSSARIRRPKYRSPYGF